MHNSICMNGCKFAEKRVFLSRAGTTEQWLYRCNKVGKLVMSDAIINEVGCATFTNETTEKVKEAEALIEEVNGKLEEIASMMPKQKG